MDLYSGGGSIAQVNSQTAQTRADNQATQDFNNTLAENLDLATTELDSAAAGSEALEAGSEGARLALDAGRTALKGAAMTGGKALIAGAGGALDFGEDIAALASGKSGMDVFGSNNYSRVGNLMNIAGSALEVGGVVSGGITPWSIGAELLGAGVSAVGAGLELAGDIDTADKKKETTTQDIQSQARSLGGTQAVTTEVARSN